MIVTVPERVRAIRVRRFQPRIRRTVMVAMAALVAMPSLPACSPGRSEARTDLAWPWWPNRMWISDITRVGRPDDDGLRRLEVRVCFEDPEGDPAKGCGMLEIRVDRPTERDDPIVVLVDLDDPREARRHHERVTECYMVPIEVDLPGLVAGRRLRIIAEYRGRDGAVLRDEHEVALTGPMQE